MVVYVEIRSGRVKLGDNGHVNTLLASTHTHTQWTKKMLSRISNSRLDKRTNSQKDHCKKRQGPFIGHKRNHTRKSHQMLQAVNLLNMFQTFYRSNFSERSKERQGIEDTL